MRATWIALAGSVLLVLTMVVADLVEAGKPSMDSAAELREPMLAGVGIVLAAALAIMAATRVSAEYRYGTIGQRLLATPDRARLLVSRVLAHGLAAAVVSAAVFAVTAAISLVMADAEGLSLGLGAGDVARNAGEVLLSGTLLAVLGVAVGFLTRSQSGAILALLGMFLGEKLFSGLLGDVADYLPTSLMDSLVENRGAPLAAGTAALALTALVAAVTVVAGSVLSRRDVT